MIMRWRITIDIRLKWWMVPRKIETQWMRFKALLTSRESFSRSRIRYWVKWVTISLESPTSTPSLGRLGGTLLLKFSIQINHLGRMGIGGERWNCMRGCSLRWMSLGGNASVTGYMTGVVVLVGYLSINQNSRDRLLMSYRLKTLKLEGESLRWWTSLLFYKKN